MVPCREPLKIAGIYGCEKPTKNVSIGIDPYPNVGNLFEWNCHHETRPIGTSSDLGPILIVFHRHSGAEEGVDAAKVSFSRRKSVLRAAATASQSFVQ